MSQTPANRTRKSLAMFLKVPSKDRIDQEIVMRNRRNALSLLKSVSDKNAVYLNETCIMAWAQVGR